MTKYIHPEETLNIYYRVSEDTEELKNIVHIEKDGEEENISDIPYLQNTKIIQWSPDENEHNGETFEFDIDGFGTKKVKVVKIPKDNLFLHYDANKIQANNGDIISEWPDLKNGFNATGGNAEYFSNLKNGCAGLYFNSEDNHYRASITNPPQNKFEIYSVAKFESTSDKITIHNGLTEDGTSIGMNQSRDGDFSIYGGDFVRHGSTNKDYQIHSGYYNTEDNKGIYNRTGTELSGSIGSRNWYKDFEIGAEQADRLGRFMNGYILEILVYSTLDESRRDNVINYLSAKYNINI